MKISQIGHIRVNKNPSAPAKNVPPSSTPGPVDTVTLGSSFGGKLKSGLRKALLATALFTTLAGPALSQTPPGGGQLMLSSLAPTERVMTTPSDSLKTAQQDRTFNVEFNFVNDNGPGFMHQALGGTNNLLPGESRYGDDDGWTSELRLQAAFGKGEKQTTLGARLMMLTETGSWNRDQSGSTYQGRRTDIGEVVVQKSTINSLREGTTLELGFGGGLQGIGNLGGESIQRAWHERGPFGGRTGTALQGQYTSESFRALPILTAGAELVQQAGPFVAFKLGAQTTIPVGSGVGRAGVRSSVEGHVGPVKVEVGGSLDAGWSFAPETSFHNINGVRPGAFGKVEVKAGKVGSVYTKVETGGFHGEPILNVGLRIGLNGSHNLNPFH